MCLEKLWLETEPPGSDVGFPRVPPLLSKWQSYCHLLEGSDGVSDFVPLSR